MLKRGSAENLLKPVIGTRENLRFDPAQLLHKTRLKEAIADGVQRRLHRCRMMRNNKVLEAAIRTGYSERTALII